MSGGKKMVLGAGMAALAGRGLYLSVLMQKKHQKKTTKLISKIKKEVESKEKRLRK